MENNKTKLWFVSLSLLLGQNLYTKAVVPSGQLPTNVVPTHYRLELKIIPSQPWFSGSTLIQLKVTQPIKSFYLNGEDLTFNQVNLENSKGGVIKAHAANTKVAGVMKITLEEKITPGSYTLSVDYSAPFNENLQGLYRIKDGNQYYVFTQMESIYARYAFPSFDEPRFKTPFDIDLYIPQNMAAISNTPQDQTQILADGWKRVSFLTTKPLPTYLVAVAVGDFDVVKWHDMPPTKIRKYPLPLRGIATKGKGNQLKYALSETQAIVEALEDYFQIPYPYRKLDILAVPDFAAGAMENAGAITFREQLLLVDDKSSIGQKRRSRSVQTHELAHQWFGNLVTPVWWNDIWLNEAFATWMAATALEHKWPGEQWRRQQIRASKGAMDSDSIPSARKIRNPIKTNSDIVTAFDGITYRKGSGVLSMIENFMGKEKFREGVQKYMHKYAWKNTTAIDFFETIASVLPAKSAKAVVKSFKDFVEQAGVPLLDMTNSCVTGKSVLAITQQRYAPLGTKFKQKTLWSIPVCLKFEANGKIKEQCEVISKTQQQVILNAPGCVDWVMPNAKAAGYFRFNFDVNGWKELLTHLHKLDALEANAVLDSMNAAFASGHLSVQTLIDVIPATLKSNSWEVVVSGMDILSTLINFADEADKPRLRKLAADIYRPEADKIGLVDNTPFDKTHRLDASKLRTRLISFMALTAKDKIYRAQLSKMAEKYVGYKGDGKFHDSAIIPALRTTAMSVAVQELGQSFVDALTTHLKSSTDGTLRGWLISALTATKDVVIARELIDLSLSPEIRDNEKTSFLFSLITKKELDKMMWPWFKSHFDQLLAGLPTNYQSFTPYLFLGDCSKNKLKRLDTFLKPRLSKLTGADRNFVKAKDLLNQCLAQKAYVKPQIKKLLAKLPR